MGFFVFPVRYYFYICKVYGHKVYEHKDRAMRYYDRNRELALLKDIQKKSFGEFSKMTVLKGRRRIGKTTLGILSMEGTDTVYLFVARKAEADLCSEYAEAIRQTLKNLSHKESIISRTYSQC